MFFVRPHRECMINDGAREMVEWDEINRIDGILDFVFSWQKIPCIGISELNMKDRVRTAMSAVEIYRQACMAPHAEAPAKTKNGGGNGNGKGHGPEGEHGEGNGKRQAATVTAGDPGWL